MSSVKIISDSEFETEVLKADKPVLVYFWAPWCGPCKLVAPSVEKIANEYEDNLQVIKMEVDANPNSRDQCKVEGVPALRLFKQGEIIESHEGAITKPQLLNWLNPHLN